MLEKTLFLGKSTGAGNTQPKTLYKQQPVTIHLNPCIVLAGIIILILLMGIGLGFTESYSYLLSGVWGWRY